MTSRLLGSLVPVAEKSLEIPRGLVFLEANGHDYKPKVEIFQLKAKSKGLLLQVTSMYGSQKPALKCWFSTSLARVRPHDLRMDRLILQHPAGGGA